MFKQKEVEVVKDLSEISRMLLNFEKQTSAHSDVLSSFDIAGKKLFGDNFAYHLRAISSEYYKVKHAIDSEREFLRELRETNNSLLSTKQNEVMKVLTIMAFMTFPLSLIAAIFGMNTDYLPIVGLPYDFWIVMGIIGTTILSMLTYFRYKKWI
jgi:magnesium transporter